MVEVTIKFRDRNRSDLKLKARSVETYRQSTICVELAAKDPKVHICKEYPIDLIDEVQTIYREPESED